MKTFQVLLVAVVVACANAFAPMPMARSPAFKGLAMSQAPLEEAKTVKSNKNAAAVAAFATAMAPFAAQATDSGIDEATIIGYGAGLVACVVSLAVGFSIGYGTLAKL